MNKHVKLILAVLLTLVLNLALAYGLQSTIEGFRFKNPLALVLLGLIPIIVIFRQSLFFSNTSRMVYSSITHAKQIKPSLKIRLRPLLFVLRLVFLSLLVYALARPQSGRSEREIETEGVEIVLAVDVSTSMRAEDFKPNRLEAVKNVVKTFLNQRVSDRIGLSIFAGQSFTQCPLTLDYGVLTELVDKLDFADQDWDGTAIGNGLANAIDLIKNSDAKSKVIILLTDGMNNQGEVDPYLAADLAKTYNVRVYTIGAGTNGVARVPVNHQYFGKQYAQMQVQIDEEILTAIADQTGGKYFRATNKDELKNIYEEIDKLERTKINVKEFTRYSELFSFFLIAALVAFIIELILGNTWLQKLP
jgi:Ca-activated chloride channel family protein